MILFDMAATNPITLKLISFAEQRDRPAITGIRENITGNPTFSPKNSTQKIIINSNLSHCYTYFVYLQTPSI